MKATVVHMVAINPEPIATFEKVGVFRLSPSRYVPAVTARPVHGGNPAQLILPMLVVDVSSEEDLDKLHEQLKLKLDQGFAEYKERWHSFKKLAETETAGLDNPTLP